MTDIKIEDLEKNQTKLTFTVPHEEMKPFLEEAVKRISEHTDIPGFRPGKADYETVKKRVGEMKIYEEALEPIVRKYFVQAVLDHKLETVGSPKFDVGKLAPGNDLVFTAEIARMPQITRLADYKKLKITAKKIETTDKEIELALNDVRRMQTKETRATSNEACAEKNKIVISMNMKKDSVPVEGGQSSNHAIYLSEEYYIPGFKEQVIGMKEGENKTFTLNFPKEHAMKMLAGSDVEFEIELKEIYHLETPELGEEFAKSLGQKNVDELKVLVKKNIDAEKEREEDFRQEKEMLELIAKDSRFDDIPDLLLNEEINKMIQELKQGVESQGGEFEKYLESIKKTLADLKLDFSPQALNRIKAALIVRSVAEKEQLEVDKKEVDAEIDKLAAQYEDEKIKKQIFSPQYRDYVETMLRNRKVIELLKKEIVK
jgi:trigger factor